MNARFDTLDYANAMEAAGIPRPHAQAIAKGLADLVNEQLLTRDFLRSELAVMKTELRDEIRKEVSEVRKEIARLELQIRALQFGGAIAAFALGAVVLLTRLL